jgi:hypothetical protein
MNYGHLGFLFIFHGVHRILERWSAVISIAFNDIEFQFIRDTRVGAVLRITLERFGCSFLCCS